MMTVLKSSSVLCLAIALAFSVAIAADGPTTRGLDAVALWETPEVDVDRLLAEDEANRDRKEIPYRIGYAMNSDLSPANSGTWENLEGGGQLWRLKVGSEGALWVVLGFDRFQLQAGGELRIYDPAAKTVLGPYTHDDIRKHGELWFPPIAGDVLVVEITWPEELRGIEPDLHLGTVSHGYKAFGAIGRDDVFGDDPDVGGGISGRALGDSGSCNIDINCPLGDAWQDQKRGAVIVLSGGSAFCSGSMINTTANDCRPYVLTADHCGVGPSTTYGYNFEWEVCGGGGPTPSPTNQTVTGSVILGEYSGSDFTLVELDVAPPEEFNVYYPGWSRDPVPPTESWGIHHPRGDAKKICHNADPLVDGINYGPSHWRVTEWEEGTTEPSSSGSPMFDQNQRIVGQLHGGTASCTSITWDEYGKIGASWTGGGTRASRLSDWLDPEGTGALVMDGIDWSTCAIRLAGTVELDAEVYACTDTLAISMRDDHLAGNPTYDVTLTSSTEPTPETVTLTAVEPGSGTFVGTFNVAEVPPVNGDGILSVVGGDVIVVEYIDADDGEGGSGIIVQDSAAVDCAGPVISNAASSSVTGSSALVDWSTDEPADSSVTYGVTPPGTDTVSDTALVIDHSLKITGLQECSVHYYSVTSTDAAGNSATDDNLGSFFSFETGRDTIPSFDATDTPVTIPDNNPTGATSTINVVNGKTVLKATVRVNITHTYTGDLTPSLVPPTGPAIALANRRGGGGNNFIDTVFDDEATTPIASGSPPFTGSFQPDEPLSAVIGIDSAGDWQLRVVDQAGSDTGTIDAWTLTLTYPAQACGPHASLGGQTLEGDVCTAGGAGDANGFWESGEQVTFSLTVANDGSDDLTGVIATVTPITAGVVMYDGQATVGDLAAGGTGSSQAPHFLAQLPSDLVCAGSLDFHVDITANEGAWTGSFAQTVGEVVQGGGTVLVEDFETAGIPVGWTIVDGLADGNTWYADDSTDPAGCGNTDPAAPVAGTWAAVDSDCTGSGVAMDEELITPVLDLSGATGVTLEFDHYFNWLGPEFADVDVRSALTGGGWVNVGQWTADTGNPEHVAIDISAQAAGVNDLQIRWHYYNADYEWFWYIDNVVVSYSAPGGCNLIPCLTAGSGPPPVPDGGPGSQPVEVGRLAADGSQLLIEWDDQCAPASTKILYGSLDQVSTYVVDGGVCAIANPQTWDAVPAGDLWFVLVSDDGIGNESSWGRGVGGERNGMAASGQCGSAAKDVSGTCP